MAASAAEPDADADGEGAGHFVTPPDGDVGEHAAAKSAKTKTAECFLMVRGGYHSDAEPRRSPSAP